MPHNNEYSLSTFLEEWMVRQNNYLHQLRQALTRQQEDELKEIIIVVLGHYQRYYEAKSRASREDVFSLFSAPWFSTYEKSFLWIAGFKPGLAFGIVKKAVNDISQEQEVKLRKLGAEINRKEKELSKELAQVQESAASVEMVKLSKELGRQLDGATTDVNEELENLREKLQVLVQSADCLRMWTAREVLEILEPVQAVKFLAAATQLQIRIRSLGQQRDEQRMSG